MVVSVLLLPPSCGQVRIASVGAASVTRTTSAASAAASGCRATPAAQRAVRGTLRASTRPRRTLRGSRRWPASPQSAGTRVIAAAITESTAIAVAKPKLE